MWNYTLYDNTILTWIYAAAVVVAVFIATRVVKYIAIKQLSKLKKVEKIANNGWYQAASEAFATVHWIYLLLIAVFAGSRMLSLSDDIEWGMAKAVFVATLLQIGYMVSRSIKSLIESYRKEKIQRNAAAVTTMLGSISFLLRLFLWSIILLVALDNFGVNITALVAGLGVGGVAVALAVQRLLGDILASFSIVLDKPFVVGDFIIVDDFMGTIEHVGLKTTRIRSLSGEQLVFSNDDLLRSRIRNYARMIERRVVFSLGIVYETPLEKIKAIPGMIREIIEAQDKTRFDRSHFKDYGAYSLDYETVYYVLGADYNLYMDIQQAINFAIFERFADEGISFAYPTQLLHVPKLQGNAEGKKPMTSNDGRSDADTGSTGGEAGDDDGPPEKEDRRYA